MAEPHRITFCKPDALLYCDDPTSPASRQLPLWRLKPYRLDYICDAIDQRSRPSWRLFSYEWQGRKNEHDQAHWKKPTAASLHQAVGINLLSTQNVTAEVSAPRTVPQTTSTAVNDHVQLRSVAWLDRS